MIVSSNYALMSSYATNLRIYVRTKLHNADRKKSNVKYSVKRNAKRRISTRSGRSKGERTKKRRKRRKKMRLIDFESLKSSNSSLKLRIMTWIEILVEIGGAKRRIFSKLSKKDVVRKKQPRRPRMIAGVLMKDTRGNVKIA